MTSRIKKSYGLIDKASNLFIVISNHEYEKIPKVIYSQPYLYEFRLIEL